MVHRRWDLDNCFPAHFWRGKVAARNTIRSFIKVPLSIQNCTLDMYTCAVIGFKCTRVHVHDSAALVTSWYRNAIM